MTDPDWLRGDWMQTYTGKQFWPMDPHNSEIDPDDIAHALSMLCRYGGHASEFYCPTPDQRILTADLRWVPAGDLKVGDELLGFDETPHEAGSTGKNRRRFRHSTVLTAIPVRRQVIRLVMADGSTVRSSAEHPWLVATKQSRNQAWVTTAAIAEALAAGRKRYMHKFVEPWSFDTSRDGGWMAGIMDGEGHISFVDRGGVQFGVAQRPGLVLKEIEAGFARLGFTHTSRNVGTSDVQSLQILGGWRELARLLGTLRPIRLLDKFVGGVRAGQFDKQLDGLRAPMEIVGAFHEGEEWVSGLETSTRTYLCEGFGAHNSVAEHCVLMSYAVSPENALAALLHDASEAYLVDVPRPIKRSPKMEAYRLAEARMMDAIAARFGLSPQDDEYWYTLPAEVKDADTRILVDERARLMSLGQDHDWGLDGIEPLGVKIQCWSPMVAEDRWRNRLKDLTEL